MFKKNPNRPPIIVDLKKTPTGYKVQSHESHQLFVMKRVTRTMYRRSNQTIQLISFRLQTWAWSLRASPTHSSLAPSYSHLLM